MSLIWTKALDMSKVIIRNAMFSRYGYLLLFVIRCIIVVDDNFLYFTPWAISTVKLRSIAPVITWHQAFDYVGSSYPKGNVLKKKWLCPGLWNRMSQKGGLAFYGNLGHDLWAYLHFGPYPIPLIVTKPLNMSKVFFRKAIFSRYGYLLQHVIRCIRVAD